MTQLFTRIHGLTAACDHKDSLILRLSKEVTRLEHALEAATQRLQENTRPRKPTKRVASHRSSLASKRRKSATSSDDEPSPFDEPPARRPPSLR